MPFSYYFNLIKTYTKIVMDKLNATGTQDAHLNNGVKKITEANKLVDE
jgi:hypothetical protein